MVTLFDELTVQILSDAFQKGTETAYKAVMKPKEGTILTVAKGMSDKAAELPLAPRNDPEEIAFANEAMVGFSIAATSFAADIIVIDIFVPVSPSGTGNTYSSLIHSFLASSC